MLLLQYNMIRKTVFVLLICTVLNPVYSQRILSKSIPQKHGQYIHIDASRAFEVKLRSVSNSMVSASAVTEGEYENDILLNLWEEGADIFIGIDFHPERKDPNDKLGAHKILSVAMEIAVPESCSVYLNGHNVQFGIEGKYKELSVTLQEGTCELTSVYGTIGIRTNSADISLLSEAGAIEATSKNGRVFQEDLPLGPAEITLESKSGDIRISRKK